MMGRDCAVHRHREDVPLEVHHIWPMGDGGPDKAHNRVRLCANAHGAIHDLIDKGRKVKGPGNLPWLLKRRYGRKVRQLAATGWAFIAAAKPPKP